MCGHPVTVVAGPAVRVCTACGALVERIPEPAGCEAAACDQREPLQPKGTSI